MTTEATTPEARHGWVIASKPQTDPGAIAPTDAQKAAAKAKLDAALKDIAGGKTWEDVAKTVSTDAATAPQGGDLGWVRTDDTLTDEAFLKAVFAAPANTPTAVVEGADGVFRVGRTTEIAPAAVDPDYLAKIQNDKIDLAKYRQAVAGDVIRQKLEDKAVADMTGPAPQRHVSEIYIPDNSDVLGGEAIKVRHILYSPKDDPANAASVPADDEAWKLAEAEATATYQKLEAQPDLFDSDRPHRERRGSGPRRQRHRRQAALLRQGQPGRPGVQGRDLLGRGEARAPCSSRSSRPSAGT